MTERQTIRDHPIYQAFVSELLILILARKRLAKRLNAQKDAFDANTEVMKSMRRLIPLARALYLLISGDDDLHFVKCGRKLITINANGDVWVDAHKVASEVNYDS